MTTTTFRIWVGVGPSSDSWACAPARTNLAVHFALNYLSDTILVLKPRHEYRRIHQSKLQKSPEWEPVIYADTLVTFILQNNHRQQTYFKNSLKCKKEK